MTPVSSQKVFSCRGRTLTDRSNRDCHGKCFNHKPIEYNTIQLYSRKKKRNVAARYLIAPVQSSRAALFVILKIVFSS